MEYPFQITSIEQYKEQYQKSVDRSGNFLGRCCRKFLLEKKMG